MSVRIQWEETATSGYWTAFKGDQVYRLWKVGSQYYLGSISALVPKFASLEAAVEYIENMEEGDGTNHHA